MLKRKKNERNFPAIKIYHCKNIFTFFEYFSFAILDLINIRLGNILPFERLRTPYKCKDCSNRKKKCRWKKIIYIFVMINQK